VLQWISTIVCTYIIIFIYVHQWLSHNCQLRQVSPYDYHYYYYYNRLTAFFSGTIGSASTRKVNHSGFYCSKRWWGGSGISWTICKSFAPRSRQITTPIPHHSVFYRPDAPSAAQPTASKHWRHIVWPYNLELKSFSHKLQKVPKCKDETITTYPNQILLCLDYD